ncbi:TRAP transporter substrate-binding protein DctP [Paracoccus sp. Z330]|uniref:TRAP transporter substrate-binding protein DctP n=1 Tax=Paracoccus onchidii TaxID=3017813 RepID=A0ABT4ZGI1_9RHOB|nr:TRAP transporter substrate-binding protein DctP [Paracoccus onchidii]MDB6178202.1 TRAP transporter substrate-binding protein DctP [Paracoccus onchidii]
MKTLLTTIAAAALATPLMAQTQLQVQTSTQSGGFSFRYLDEQWTAKLAEMTDGEVALEFLPIDAVVPRTETPEVVAAGVLGGDLTSVAYFSGRDPAFAILGDLIAGYDTPQQVQDFCRVGGGAEALQELWDQLLPDQIHVIGCGAVSKEALVSAVPIRGVDDLQGVKIRSPEGLAATVFSKAGASPVNIPFSEVFTSLEKKVVDAADASAYVNNDQNGFHEIATYPLYPGIHSMAVHQFTVGQTFWDGLSPEAQAGLTEWFYAAYADLASALHEEDEKLAERDRAGDKIEVIDWAQEDRDRFREIAVEAWEETADKSPAARKALDAQMAYMRSIDLLD